MLHIARFSMINVNWLDRIYCLHNCLDVTLSAIAHLDMTGNEQWGPMILCRWCHGSPVHRYGLYALQWIIEINGQPTPDLETFIQVVKVRVIHQVANSILCDFPVLSCLVITILQYIMFRLCFGPSSSIWINMAESFFSSGPGRWWIC